MRRMLAVAALLTLLSAACSPSTTQLAGFVRTPLPDVGGTSLPDVSAGGESFAMRAEPDGILLMYFGFTSCPDVCPATLADVRSALRDLGEDAQRVALAMATVDPGRDTAENLSNYVQAFVENAHALRTEDDVALRKVATAFGADYEVIVADDGSVEVGHTAHLYAVDADGLLQVTWPFGTASAEIASDLRTLLDST